LKAVIFHVHGNGFQAGSGSDPSFGGEILASRGGVVVVTLNYRLTILGPLALDNGITNGNYAVAEMITAHDWVRAHIEDFGGDPKRITIMDRKQVRSLLRQ
jgi:carboxylesterase type B